MVVVYVDTSVIIARYKPSDPLFSSANKLFQMDYEFIISPITLVELYSVLLRVKPFLEFRWEIRDVNVDTIIAFILHDSRLKIVERSFMSRLQILGKKLRIPLEYYLAVKLTEKLQLKTLDMLHIAYAYMLRNAIDYIVTGDNDILRAKEKIKQYVGLEVKDPSELI